MNTHVEQNSENDSQRAHVQRKGEARSGGAPTLFADNRPSASLQRKLRSVANNSPRSQDTAQLQSVIQKKENKTGLPDNLKSGIESLSGMSMGHVNVHYNSSQPALLNAHAYAQGSDIHVATGQEQHLPHEAWHVVQQAQGRVQPTQKMAAADTYINDDEVLENEADSLGAAALSLGGGMHVRSGEDEDQIAKEGQSNSSASNNATQLAAAAPSSGNAADYDDADLDATAGTSASAMAEVKVTVANKNKKSEPTEPVNSQYMLQTYGDKYKKVVGTATNSTAGPHKRKYVPTDWQADFNLDLNKNTNLTRTHIVHHSFARNANNNGDNIVWANAYLNNSMYLKGATMRSIADREHEDRDSLNAQPFGTGNRKLVSNLYGAGLTVRPYAGSWYTDNSNVGVSKTIVPSALGKKIYPSSSKVWKLVGEDLAMWYQATPVFNTGFDYSSAIVNSLEDVYDNRVDPQHEGEKYTNKNSFKMKRSA